MMSRAQTRSHRSHHACILSSSPRWRRALSHQLQHQAAGCCRQHVRCLSLSHTAAAQHLLRPRQVQEVEPGRPWPSWPLRWNGETPCWPRLTDQPDRPTRLTARPVLDQCRSGAGGCGQGAETADPARLQHSCAAHRRVGFHTAWPWLSRGRGVSGALVAAIRPSGDVEVWKPKARPMGRNLLPAC